MSANVEVGWDYDGADYCVTCRVSGSEVEVLEVVEQNTGIVRRDLLSVADRALDNPNDELWHDACEAAESA